MRLLKWFNAVIWAPSKSKMREGYEWALAWLDSKFAPLP